MATPQEIAAVLDAMNNEFVRRLDELVAEGKLDSSSNTYLAGISEGLASITEALQQCNGLPSPTLQERCALLTEEKKKECTLSPSSPAARSG